MTAPAYANEIDRIDKASWDGLITQFDDATLYQAWSFGALPGKTVSHIVVKEGDRIRGCCQVTIRRLPHSKIGLADVRWGPLCLKKEEIFDPEILWHMVRAIKNEYAVKRGYLLRIEPHVKGPAKEPLRQILEDEGFKRNDAERPYRTFLLDLSPSLDDLRKNFLQKWRNCLNKAERGDLDIVDGVGDDFYKIFLDLAGEMVERKSLTQAHLESFRGYRLIQENLPAPLKMRIWIAKKGPEPVCAAVCSAIGDTGIYVFGATGQKGLEWNASYAVQWRMITWMKENGVRYYDLGAFNEKLNPGVYHFKMGIAGKRGWEETFLGVYLGCFSLSGHITKMSLHSSRLLQDAKNTISRIGSRKQGAPPREKRNGIHGPMRNSQSGKEEEQS